MADLALLQDTFDAGVKRDSARDALPKGALWWAEDMLPGLAYQGQAARLRERGGYAFYSNSITAVVATAQYVIGGIVAPYTAGSTMVVVDEDGRVIKVAANGTVTDVAAGNVVSQNPVFHRDMAILPGATPKKVTNSGGTLSVANLGGTPPASTYATVFNDRTLLARHTSTTAQYRRLWFGGAGNPESWDTTNTYWDFSFDITGLASLKTAILVFHESYVSRLRGTTPPTLAGGTGDFFADDPLWQVGCTDARSIAYWGDRVLFASPEGIFISDGAALDDVTAKAGMQSWWQETLGSYANSTWTIVGGTLRGFYCVAVMDGATFKAGAMIDLRRLAWWPTTNIKARSMFVGQGAADELYFGNRDTDRVSKLSTVFMPTSTVKNDGDGTAVTGLVETPFYRGRTAQKAWRRLFLTQYLRDYATDNPTLAVSYVKTPEATAYTALSGSYAENTAETKRGVPLGFPASGIALKLDRTGAGDWQLNAIEADVHAREGSR